MADKWSPPNFENLADQLLKNPAGAGHDVDQSIQIIYKQLSQTSDTLNGIKNGSTVVTGSSLRVATGLTEVTNAVVCLESSSPLNEWATVIVGGAWINIYVWKPTAAGNNTPIASTTARTVRWVAFGTQ